MQRRDVQEGLIFFCSSVVKCRPDYVQIAGKNVSIPSFSAGIIVFTVSLNFLSG